MLNTAKSIFWFIFIIIVLIFLFILLGLGSIFIIYSFIVIAQDDGLLRAFVHLNIFDFIFIGGFIAYVVFIIVMLVKGFKYIKSNEYKVYKQYSKQIDSLQVIKQNAISIVNLIPTACRIFRRT